METTKDPRLDDLTNVIIRKAFLEELDKWLEKSQNDGRSFSLAMIDIDRFFSINDQYGHVAGDNVIVAVANTIKNCSGQEALIGRFGGDEFSVLLPYREREQSLLVLERSRAEVERLQVQGSEANTTISGITISVGIASFPIDGRTESELLRKSDQALYRAKQTGRNQVRLSYEERMVPKTSHFTQTQLERLAGLAEEKKVGEAELLREALDDLLVKYGVNDIES